MARRFFYDPQNWSVLSVLEDDGEFINYQFAPVHYGEGRFIFRDGRYMNFQGIYHQPNPVGPCFEVPEPPEIFARAFDFENKALIPLVAKGEES